MFHKFYMKPYGDGITNVIMIILENMDNMWLVGKAICSNVQKELPFHAGLQDVNILSQDNDES